MHDEILPLQKAEAIRRMQTLNVDPAIIQRFDNENCICVTDPTNGIFNQVSEEQLKAVHNFEKDYDCLVYFGIRSYSSFGELINWLYVTSFEEEWPLDLLDIENDEAVVWVQNVSSPECSEIGSIGLGKTEKAGLCRTW